ncbi:MAG TPA: hypothetical protein PLA83_08925 [Deltaproteobacteria bacterium]|nr:hypothetical protein [Deltaproteobacteria bacterium]
MILVIAGGNAIVWGKAGYYLILSTEKIPLSLQMDAWYEGDGVDAIITDQTSKLLSWNAGLLSSR